MLHAPVCFAAYLQKEGDEADGGLDQLWTGEGAGLTVAAAIGQRLGIPPPHDHPTGDRTWHVAPICNPCCHFA